MNIDTARFFSLIALSLCLFYSFRSLAWRQAVLLGTSGAFITSFFSSPSDAFPLIAYIAAIFGGVYVLAWKRSLTCLWIAIGLLVGLFLTFKNYLPMGIEQQSTWVTVGISYIMFRAIHILVDLHDGSLEKLQLRPLDLCLYLTSIFTFASGPIQRYEDFQEQLYALPRKQISDLNLEFLIGRIVKGLFKVVILAPLLLGIHQHFLPEAREAAIHLTGAAIAFLAYVYLNFSGSMDIIIAVGGLYGFQLPENFNRPYLASSFLDLWNRWHITLSSLFKIYVFFPFIRTFHRLPIVGQYPILAGIFGFFIVFFLLGIWHGNTTPFVFYGIALGAAAAINKGWEQWRTKRHLPVSMNTWPQRLLEWIASATALSYLALAVVVAWPSVGSFSDLMSVYATPSHLAISFLFLIAILAIARGIIEYIIGHYALKRTLHPWFYSAAISLGLVTILWLKAAGQENFSTLNFYQRF